MSQVIKYAGIEYVYNTFIDALCYLPHTCTNIAFEMNELQLQINNFPVSIHIHVPTSKQCMLITGLGAHNGRSAWKNQ